MHAKDKNGITITAGDMVTIEELDPLIERAGIRQGEAYEIASIKPAQTAAEVETMTLKGVGITLRTSRAVKVGSMNDPADTSPLPGFYIYLPEGGKIRSYDVGTGQVRIVDPGDIVQVLRLVDGAGGLAFEVISELDGEEFTVPVERFVAAFWRVQTAEALYRQVVAMARARHRIYLGSRELVDRDIDYGIPAGAIMRMTVTALLGKPGGLPRIDWVVEQAIEDALASGLDSMSDPSLLGGPEG